MISKSGVQNTWLNKFGIFYNFNCAVAIIEPRHEKTGFLHMPKQRRRSAVR